MARFISPLGQTPDTKDISSSGNFTIDAIADIVLDADGDEVIFKDGSTNVGHISMDSDNLTIKSLVSDKDIIVQGNDGGSGITAITLDMSAAGKATFNNEIVSGAVITSGAGLVIADDGTIGSASDADAITIAANGNTTFSQDVTVSGNLTVSGTTTQINTVTMNAENAVVFEGATADAHETTLTIIDPTADRTQRLLNQSGFIPLLAAVTTTAITSTPEELNILDGATVVVGEINALDLGSTAVGTAIASKAVILDSNKDYTGIRNFTVSGELDAATGDFSGDVDVDGTLEADAITVNGTTLDEFISDTVGAMVGSNTETGIAVTYQDENNTIDFALDAAQTTITSLLATDIKIGEDDQTKIDFETADEIHFYAANAHQIKLVDGALVPVTDNDIDLGTSSLEFKDAFFDGTVTSDAFAGPLTGNVTGNVSGTAATVTGAAQTNITSLGTLTALTVDNVVINGATIGHGDDTDLMTVADGILTVAGEVSMTTLDIGGTNVTSTAAELNILDGVTSTAAELNILDGVTSTAAELNVLDGITAVVGELNALDLGSTAVGTAIASKAVILDSNKDYTGVRNLTISGELDAGSLDISGDVDVDGTLEADAITVNGATLTEHITDLVGGMVGGNTETGITVTFQDDDNTLDFALGAAQTTITSLLATDIKIGEDDQTKIDFETADEIHFYAANAHQVKIVDGAIVPATDNDVDLGTSSAEFKDAYFDGTVTADAFAGPITGNLTGTLQTAAQGNVTSLGTLTTLTVDNIIINGTNIGHTSDTDSISIASDGVVTFSQAPVFPDGSIAVADLDIDGATDVGAALVDADLFIVDDGAGGTNRKSTLARLKTYMSAGSTTAADDIDAGDAAVTITTSSGNITIDAAANDSDIILKGTDGGADTDFLTIDGSAAGKATFNNEIVSGAVITSGAGLVIADAGNIGSASDTDAIAIASDGVVTMNQIPVFSAGINVSGGTIAGTLATAAQGNITSLGTLTTLTVDNVVINGATIGHGDDTDLMTVADGILTVAGEVSMTTLDIGGTNVTSTAAELNILDGVTSTAAELNILDGVTSTAAELNALDGITAVVGELNALDLGSTAVGTAIASKAVILDSNKDYTGVRNFTLSGELDAGSLDVSGDVDIDGTLEADAITVNGTTLAETISDTVGAMVGGNTETGIAVTYQDSNNTIDFALDAAQTTITSLLATDIKIGEDDQTKIDFETADEIHFYAANAHQVKIVDGAIVPVTDNDIDLGTSSLEFKNAFFDGTVTSDAFAGPLTGDVTGTSSKVTVTNSTANTDFPVVFHDESDSLLDDTGALRYNPSSGTLLVPNLVVAGTTTQVDTVTMNAENAVVFEGATADAHETTLTIIDPTADRTQRLINQSGYIPLLAAVTTTAITSTPAELNILDGVTSTAAELNILDGVTSTTAELNILDGVTSTAAELNILDGVTSTAAELNILDGVTSTAAELNVLDGITAVVGELNALDIGSTAVGTAVASKAVILDSNKDYTGIRNLTISGEIDAATGDFSGAVDVAGATTTAALTASGILKTDDATEATSTTDGSLQTDGGLSVVKDAVFGDDIKLLSDAAVAAFGADGDVTVTHVADTGLLLNAAMVMQFRDSAINIGSPADGDLDINADDEIELNSTLIDVNGNLDVSGTIVGASTLSATTGTFSGILKTDDATEATSTTDGSLQTDGGLSVVKDAVFGDDVLLLSDAAVIKFGANSDVTLTHVADAGLTLSVPATADNSFPTLTLAAGDNDIAVNDVLGALDFVAPAEGAGTDAVAVAGSVRVISEGNFAADNNASKMSFMLGSSEAATEKMSLSSAGVLATSSLDISGDVDIDGTLEADAITVNGATLTEHITDLVGGMVGSNTETGITVTFQDADNTLDFALGAAQTTITSLLATDIKIGEDDQTKIDFETADEIHFYAANAHQIKLVDGALVPVTDNDIDLGTSSLEFKNAFFDGTVTADAFAGPINGDLTGTLQTAAQANVTSLGTLTALTVDNVVINGATIGHGDDTDLMTVADGILTVAGEVSMTTLDIGGTNVTSTAAELNVLDGITAVVGELNALDIGSTAVGTAVASKAVILDSNKDYTGMRNLTISGELDAGSLDVSGNVDVDGTLETDAFSIGGTTVTSTAAELNILDGVTSTAAELNILDGVTSTAAELNILDGVTSTAAELNVLDGITAVVGELNALDIGSTAVGTAVASKAVILDSNKDYTGIRNLTLSGLFKLSSTSGPLIQTTGDLSTTDITLIRTGINTNSADFGFDIKYMGARSGNANSYSLFMHNQQGTHVEAMTVIQDGKVGILNTSPSQALDVTGNILSSALIIADAGTIGSASDTDAIAIASDGVVTFSQALVTTGITIGSTAVTSTAAELNILDGVTSTAAELNILDGVTSTAAELNILDGVTSTAAELNILDGVTSTAAELNVLDGITAVVGELNALDIGSTAVGTAVASKAVILDSNKDYTGIRNLTISGELDAGSLDVSGDIDVDGTTNLDVVDIDGAVDMASTLGVAGVVTANAGVVVDNITIDGTEIDLSSGDLTLDVAGDIILNADGADIKLADASVTFGHLSNSSSDFVIESKVQDKDIIFKGDDGGSGITALTLDMSDAGTAIFNSVVKSSTYFWMNTDNGVGLRFGVNAEIKVTHVHDTGLTFTNTINGTDNRPFVLQLKSEEDAIVADDVIASIELAAGDSDGTDGATVAAGIHAIAEDTFSASANKTKLVFTTGVSETAASSATAKMTLSSAGLLTIADDFVIKDGGTIGVASDADAITIASNGQVTLTQTLIGTALDISGDVDIDGTLEADAITVNGTTLAETISDTVGAMVGSNTETGIAVTYQDGDNTIDFAINAAQTTITSLLATDIKIGEDDQTKIDFETADEIHFYAANAHQVKIVDGAIVPATDNDVDLGTSSAEFKNAFFDGTVTSDAFAGPLTGDVTGTSSKVTVTDSTANTNFPVVFHNESDGLLDDTGALRYNPSSGTLLVPNLTVAGTTTQVDTVTMNAANAVVFEGATADAHETTLTIIDPTGDRTINLPNVSGTIPVLAAASTTQITSTPAELNILDGVTSTAAELNILDGVTSTAAELNILDGVTSTAAELNVLDGITAVVGELNALDIGSTAVGTAVASKAVILDSNKDYTGIRNLTISGEIDAATGDFSGAVDVAGATTTAAITASGIIKTDDATDATSTTDGSLQTDGGLSVVKDAVFGDDVRLKSDSAILSFGADNDIHVTHLHNSGLKISHNFQSDDTPLVLQLKSEEDAIIANEVIASLEFAAGDSDGTDGATVAAGIHAIAENTFSASANPTKLVFTAGVSETAAASATAKATLSSIGDFTVAGDLVIKDGGLIGSASDLDAIAIAADGVVTFTQDPVAPEYFVGSSTDHKIGKVNHTFGDGIGLTTDSATVTIGAANAHYIHYFASNSLPHWFNTTVYTNGNFMIYNDTGALIWENNRGTSHEVTLTTTTPSAARTITLPDETGTVHTSGGSITIPDAGTIGSASDTDAIAIGSDGDVTLTQDLELQHDGAILSFGANDEVTLTHVHNDGLLLNADMQLQFRDSAINIRSDADGDLDINADDEIELNSTLIDVNGNLDVSGTIVGASTLSATTGTFSGILKTDDATEATSTTDGSLQTDGGLSVVKDAVFGDDIKLLSDAAVAAFGANGDVTLTHVHNTGLLLNAAMVVQFRDSAINIGSPADGDLDINADDEIELNSTLIDVNGNLDVSGTIVGASTLSATTGTFSGILKTDDATEATSTTDGSLQTDGGLSVVKDIVAGDDIKLLSDAAVIHFGTNSEITATHVHNVGLTLTHTATGDNTPMVLQLKSEEDAIIANEVIASLEFAAGDSDGTDGATVAAGIHAIAEGTFSASANATKLVFTTGVSETAAASATAKMTLSSAGLLTIADDLVIKDGGTIGVASDADSMTIASNGVVTFSQIPVLPDNTVSTGDLQADAVTGAKIADDAINSEHYTDGSIDTAHIADDQITQAKMANDSVGSAEMKTLSTLLIKNSSGSTLKTLHGAGA